MRPLGDRLILGAIVLAGAVWLLLPASVEPPREVVKEKVIVKEVVKEVYRERPSPSPYSGIISTIITGTSIPLYTPTNGLFYTPRIMAITSATIDFFRPNVVMLQQQDCPPGYVCR